MRSRYAAVAVGFAICAVGSAHARPAYWQHPRPVTYPRTLAVAQYSPKPNTPPFAPDNAKPAPAACDSLALGAPVYAKAIVDYQNQLQAVSSKVNFGSASPAELDSWMNNHPDPLTEIEANNPEPNFDDPGTSDQQKAAEVDAYTKREGDILASVAATWGYRSQQIFPILDRFSTVLLNADNDLGDRVYFEKAILLVKCKVELSQDIDSLIDIANDLEEHDRYAEAEPYLRRAIAMAQADRSGDKRGQEGLAMNLYEQKRWAEAEPLLRAIGRSVELARTLHAEKKYPEEETVLRSLLSGDAYRKELAINLAAQKRYGEAVDVLAPLLEKAAQHTASMTRMIVESADYQNGAARQEFANWEYLAGRSDKAAADFALACNSLRNRLVVGDPSTFVPIADEGFPTTTSVDCNRELLERLWQYKPLTAEAQARLAFVAAQEITTNSAAAALAQSIARAVAVRAGGGELLRQIDEVSAKMRSVATRYRVDDLMKRLQTETDPESVHRNAVAMMTYANAQKDLSEQLDGDIVKLLALVPDYADIRAPEPVPMSELQSGARSPLLGADEILIQFYVPPGTDRGFVVAVTREKCAWAAITLNGREIADIVQTLRAQIDPRAYGGPGHAVGPFDRKLSFKLYQALLGAPGIQGLLNDDSKKTVLFVPSGPLTSMPFAVLVTAATAGDAADATAMRATPWLLRRKAIAVLPAVSSLRLLRQSRARRAAQAAPDPLLAFADPDFAGAGYGYAPPPSPPSSLPSDRSLPRGIEAYYDGNRPNALALRSLQRLEGTRDEAEALRRDLNAPASSLHEWDDASETELNALQDDGRLARVRIIEFATHGLVAGDFAGLAQPALALAAPKPGSDPAKDDGLLTASEAATLNLNAEWVILSACNTAAPDAPDAQGLSGLSRAFFLAGARSLLVSHWRVRDDVAPVMIPDAIARLSDGRAATKAQALQQAELAILDDTKHPDFAFPYAWAPFALIGETAP